MTLTKADLIQLIVDRVGLNRREAAEIVEAFFEEISRTLEAGEDVKLSGFGGFQLRDKSARLGRNPKTGEGAVIRARRVVTFYPSQKLKVAASGLATTGGTPQRNDEFEATVASRADRSIWEPA